MEDEQVYRGSVGRPFAVADAVYCGWEFDHAGRTLEYLEGFDPRYFVKVAAMLAERIESEDASAASVALRVLYHQGIETLMLLLGAAVQGPTVVPAWIAKCSTSDLKDVVARLRKGQVLLTQTGQQRVTFEALSIDVHSCAWPDETGDESTATRFGRFWHQMAGEFLDEKARAEYNALKHGTRVVPGGFTLSIGEEEVFGEPPPPDRMRAIGGSRFGSTFFITEPVREAKWHVHTRRMSLNWSPLTLASRLHLVSLSLSNIVGALRCGLGVDPTTVKFTRPADPTAFDEVWSSSVGVNSFSMESPIRIEPEQEVSRGHLRNRLEGRPGRSAPMT